jgi:site-specific recombinase XerD
MNYAETLTLSQTANILRINENTLTALAGAGQIPHIKIPATPNSSSQVRFNTVEITGWLRRRPAITMDEKALERWGRQLEKEFPEQLAMLREYDKRFIAPRKPKGYTLTKAPNKKLGFVYHLRYIENGKLVPTWWSTHTNDIEAAKEFAVSNREKLLSEYRQRKAQKNNSGTINLYAVMKQFYAENSEYLKKVKLRGRTLSENTRRTYHNTIINHWIPFLKKRHIKTIGEIDTPLMARYQDYCLAKGVKPQSVNYYISFVSSIFTYLVTMGHIKTNPCIGLAPLRVKETEKEVRGCYSINELYGVFNKRWDDELSCLLCLVIYTTGMRNSEMDRIQVKDIIKISKYRFINITTSKTKNGVRLVPLHDFVYGKLARYIEKQGKEPDDLLFCQENGKPLPSQHYTDANIALGMFTRQDKNKTLDAAAIKEKLDKENITFYSGRHFWKTLMNAYDLGEVEEYFMGHTVSNDMAKRYNHRDKQGQEKLLSKAGKVFQILDQRLFT